MFWTLNAMDTECLGHRMFCTLNVIDTEGLGQDLHSHELM